MSNLSPLFPLQNLCALCCTLQRVCVCVSGSVSVSVIVSVSVCVCVCVWERTLFREIVLLPRARNHPVRAHGGASAFASSFFKSPLVPVKP